MENDSLQSESSRIYFSRPQQPQTKPCPFCAETIQAAAIKCRFCGEFLNSERAKALERNSQPDSQTPSDEEVVDNVLFAARPSLWAMAGAMVKAAIFLGLTWSLMAFEIERPINDILKIGLNKTNS